MREVWLQSNYYFVQIWDGWTIKVMLAVVPGFYSARLGGDWVLLLIFSAMIALDLVFGSWLAVKRHRFEVRLFGRWVVKAGIHFLVIFIVGLSIDSILNPLGIAFPLLDLFLGMLICTEATSILKNMHHLGLPVPKLATRILANVRQQAENRAADCFRRPGNDRRKYRSQAMDERRDDDDGQP